MYAANCISSKCICVMVSGIFVVKPNCHSQQWSYMVRGLKALWNTALVRHPNKQPISWTKYETISIIYAHCTLQSVLPSMQAFQIFSIEFWLYDEKYCNFLRVLQLQLNTERTIEEIQLHCIWILNHFYEIVHCSNAICNEVGNSGIKLKLKSKHRECSLKYGAITSCFKLIPSFLYYVMIIAIWYEI